MKTINLTILFLVFSFFSIGQTFTKQDLFDFVNNQNDSYIISKIKSKDFSYVGSQSGMKMYGKVEYGVKQDKYTTEAFSIGRINGLYMVQYKPKFNYYNSYKKSIKNSSYSYAYTYGSNVFYENGTYRIGFHDSEGLVMIYANEK